MKKSRIIRSDFSGIGETQCYCSPQGALTIRELVSRQPLDAVHFIGTGDYHYVSLFFLERIEKDFALVLFDNHPDNQRSAFGGECLSCGSWVTDASALPHCRRVFWNSIPQGVPGELPVYLSIDLDVLSQEYAHTNWDQGEMTLDFLKKEIRALCMRCKVIGADICGGTAESKGGTPEDEDLNRQSVEAISAEISLSSIAG